MCSVLVYYFCEISNLASDFYFTAVCMSTIEECHLTNEKNPPKMLNYAKRRLSHAGFEMTQQQMPGGAWWWHPCGCVLQMLSGPLSVKEWGRGRVSLSTQPGSPQTGFPLLGQLASSQSHTKCFDSLFSTQRNWPGLTTDGSGSGPANKGITRLSHWFSVKRGRWPRCLCTLAGLTESGWWKCWLYLPPTSCILTGYKIFWSKSPADHLHHLAPAPQGQGETTIILGVSCHGKPGSRNDKIAGSTLHTPHWCIIKQI